MVRVGINGFGRIGRAFFRAAHEREEVEVVAVNDLGNIENLAYLLKHDTVYRDAPFAVAAEGGSLMVGGKPVAFVQEKDPAKLPWRQMQIDVVVESTGFFTSFEKARAHLDAGAKRVVISAPAHEAKEGESDPGEHPLGATVLLGLNEPTLKTCPITSNASCTTNASSPVIAILDETIGIEKAILNTTHAYTASQHIVDGPSAKDAREGRAGAMNITPTATGAAKAVTKAYPKLEGLFDGIAMRVPVVAGSIADVTFIAKRNTSVEEVNRILDDAAHEERWRKSFSVTREPLVSSDIIGMPYGSVADLSLTRVVGGNLVKVLAWYDNEWGYTHTLLEHVIEAGTQTG